MHFQSATANRHWLLLTCVRLSRRFCSARLWPSCHPAAVSPTGAASASTRCLPHVDARLIGHASQQPDVKRGGRRTNSRQQRGTLKFVAAYQATDILLLILAPVCLWDVFVLLAGTSIIKQMLHTLPRKDELQKRKPWFHFFFSLPDEESGGLIIAATPPPLTPRLSPMKHFL